MSGGTENKPYDALSIIYDSLGHHDYVTWGKYLSGLLKDSGVKPGGKLIDAACGTGGITLELARAGYSVLGMDISQQMLTEAASKAAKAGARITFIRQDIRAMRVHRPVDGVVCTCDAVNYLLTENDLLNFLKSARRSLQKGGTLLFDVSSEEKLRAMDGQLFGEETDDTAYLWTNKLNAKSAILTMDITMFIRQWDYWRREHEVHRQRAWSAAQLEAALRLGGFESSGVYAAFTRVAPEPGADRIQFKAVAV